MLIALSVAHFLIAICAIVYAARILLSGRSSLLAIHIIVFVSLASMGIAIAPHVPLEDLAYLSNPMAVPLIRNLEPLQYLRQCLSHWIFIGIALMGLHYEATRSPSKAVVPRSIASAEFWGYTALFVGIGLSFRYYVQGPGLTILKGTRLAFFTTAEAVTHRVVGYLEAGIGQGNYLASVAAYVFFPLAAGLFSLKGRRFRWLSFSLAGLFSICYAIQTRQKGPLLWTVSTYIALAFLARRRGSPKNSIKKLLIGLASIGAVGSVLLYMINFGQSVANSIQGFLYRVFLVPGASETNFFVIFPDGLPFRGILQVFGIPWGRIAATDMTTIMDVARMATGTSYSANASFLAVSWSAAGYIGVILVSLFLVVSLVALDRCFASAQKKLFYIAVAISPVYLITLISDSLYTYIGRGGLIVPLIIVLLSTAPVISFKSRPAWK